MSLNAATIDALVASGATAEILAAYVKAELAVMEAAQAEQRRRATEKKRRQRAVSPSVPGTSGDIEGQAGTEGDNPLSLPSSPQTPQLPTHTPGDINTHARKADREPEGFEAFWSVYPRRVGKDAARKAFAKATRRTSLADLIAAVRRDAESQWRDRPPDMIPHPSTWLNQARWEDEPPPESNITPLRSTHERPSRQAAQLEERYDNYRRSLAGVEIAIERGALESSGGF